MAKAVFDSEDDRFIRGLIKRKVNQLIGRAGFTPADRTDLEHDLLARVLQSRPQFDPDIGHHHAFVTAVVERYVANILRDKMAPKRDHRRITSLNVTVSVMDDGVTELAQAIGDREQEARLGCERRSQQELTELALDLAQVIATLPADWQSLLELRTSHTVKESAEIMGVPRTTLHDWMRRIRKRFEQAGLQDYLEI